MIQAMEGCHEEVATDTDVPDDFDTNSIDVEQGLLTIVPAIFAFPMPEQFYLVRTMPLYLVGFSPTQSSNPENFS